MYREMPIGSLFLWQMERKASHLIRTSGRVLPAFDMSQRHVWFVIDGQQRLSVLYQAFKGEERKNDRGRVIDFGRLCFVLQPDGDDAPRFVYRKPIDGELIPVQSILDPLWHHRVSHLPARKYNAVKECRSRLLNYPVPVVLAQNATLEEIGEVFVRVNSQGMTVTSADRAIALMGHVDVRSMATDLRDQLAAGGLELSSIDALLMGFNLIAEKQDRGGDPPKLQAMARRWSRSLQDKSAKRKLQRLWDRYKRSVLAAADYLRQAFRVYNGRTCLPRSCSRRWLCSSSIIRRDPLGFRPFRFGSGSGRPGSRSDTQVAGTTKTSSETLVCSGRSQRADVRTLASRNGSIL